MVAHAQRHEKSGPVYEGQTAASKMQQLWSLASERQQSQAWLWTPFTLGIFFENVAVTTQRVADTYEDTLIGRRFKFVHSVGSLAKFQYTTTANAEGYTGIFASGCDNGIIRFSTAKEFITSKSSADQAYDNFIPAIAMKFLRSGVHSGNVMGMYGVNGIHSWNFFKEDFSNHIPGSDGILLNLIGTALQSATPFVQYLGLSDIAKYDQDGNEAANIKFPFKLVFEPQLRNLFPETFTLDYQEQLATIASNTVLYKVYAYDGPHSVNKVEIGQLKITSQIMKSEFGDKFLFFKHQDIREDIALKPEWQGSYDRASVTSTQCPVAILSNGFKYLMEVFKSMIF
ncbi:UNKNOWN [Stylonychia lemnae]|uniref:Uncharacterized protein n=1 Tax=Stylonychia lemnae TaxID=5949 RepID=A0A078A688_STYLE|nr:UNKNOWN [Stylonychia lemnae]|eukprot:CDW76274.1 UNKNOWN [Stylonychia lemnae]